MYLLYDKQSKPLGEINANCITFPVIKFCSAVGFSYRVKIVAAVGFSCCTEYYCNIWKTEIIMRCKSGKLFLPFVDIVSCCRFCYCCCLDCCGFVVFAVPWFMSAVHLATASFNHMSKCACIGMFPFTAHYAVTDAKASSSCIINSLRVMYMLIQNFDLPAIAAQFC